MKVVNMTNYIYIYIYQVKCCDNILYNIYIFFTFVTLMSLHKHKKYKDFSYYNFFFSCMDHIFFLTAPGLFD